MKNEILKPFLGFNLMMHKTAFQIFLILSLTFSVFIVNAQGLEFYGASDDTNELILYNTDTGNTSVIGSFGATSIESMKFNSDFSVLYGIDGNQLGIIDVNNGHFTALPNPLGNNLQGSDGNKNITDADAMVFDSATGELYVAVRGDNGPGGLDLLIKVNPTTGQYVAGAFGGNDYIVIQTTGGKNDIDGLAINYTTGDLYAIANDGGVDDKLVTINKTTGAVTDLGIIRDANGSVNDIEALSILPDGRLFATSGTDKTIYKVNPNTGEVQSLIGTYAFGQDFEGSVARILNSYYLHDIPSCNVGSNSGKIDWTTDNPFDLSEFIWTPDGALINTLSDISGTGVNATVTFSGETNTLGVWNGNQAPSVDTNSNREGLQFYTDGFNNGITITIDFSMPINAIGFDLAHVNASGVSGDKYTITGVDGNGNVIYPTFNTPANPSYITDNLGNINADNFAGNQNDEIGINFLSVNKISSISIYWQNCDTCGNAIHGSALWDMDFCVDPEPTITAENDNFSGTPILSGSTTPSVFTDNGNGVDDANGDPATNANIDDNISITNDGGIVGLTINPDGTMTIPSVTPAGSYTVEYQICLDLDNTKCDTATVSITIFKDSDGDNIPDSTDLDDDNDGILDTDECGADLNVTFTINAGLSTSDNLVYEAMVFGVLQTVTVTAPNSHPGLVNGSGTQEVNGATLNVNGQIILVDSNVRESVLVFNSTILLDNITFSDMDGFDRYSYTQTDFGGAKDAVAFDKAGDWTVLNGVDLATYDVATGLLVTNNPAGNAGALSVDESSTLEFVPKGALSTVLYKGEVLLGVDNVTDNASVRFDADTPFTSISLLYEDVGTVGTESIWSEINLPSFQVSFSGCNLDTDGDNTPDYLDTDSDGDGCLDAIEATGNYTVSNTDINGMLIGGVDVNGVPLITNGGQVTTGAVIDNTDSSACLDSDGDNVPDNIDLDDDNDGILDIDEDCSVDSLQNASFETETGWTLNNDADLQASQGGIAPFDYQVASLGDPITITDNLIPVDGNYVAIGYAGSDSFSQNITINQPGDYTFCVSAQLLSGSYIDSNNGNQLRTLLETMNFELRFAGTTNSYTINTTGAFQEFCISRTINTAGTYNIRIYQPTGGNYLFAYDGAIVKIDSCNLDADGDGIPNSLDLDSDNDGITDVIESGGTDVNNDGIADGAVGNTPTTMGVPSSAGIGVTPINSDADTIPNYLDIDSDDDGIPDNIEAQTTANWIAPSGVGVAMADANNNGLDDNYENGGTLGISPNNHDNTDTPDYLDTDSDNDGVLDSFENGNVQNIASGLDTDGDGLDNVWDDVDDSAITGSTVNDNHNPPNATNLGDVDTDLANGGDVDYRDVPDPNPVLTDDTSTTNEDTPVIISIYNNDNNIPTTGTLTTTNPANGTVVITDPNNTPNDPSDDVVTYTPNQNFSGVDTFDYTVCDNAVPQNCDTATVTITVLPAPDYGPTIFTGNTTIIGGSGVVDFRVLVGEFTNGNSNGISNVELRIVKNTELAISFDNALMFLNGQPVSNNQWQYDGSHPSLHRFTYIGNGGIFNASTAQFIGINAVYTPPVGTNGAFPLKTTIKYFSGGEKNTNNNDDIDYIEYNNN